MPGWDKARTRVLAVIALLILSAAALHGYLPGAETSSQDQVGNGLGDLFALVGLLIVSMAILLICFWPVISSRRERRPEIAEARPGPESLARAAKLGLAELGDRSREPRDAIIDSYLTVARAAETPGWPQVHSAPRLAELFEEARFSVHVMTERDRDDAAQALRRVLSELQASP